MTVGISIEAEIPDSIDPDAVIAIGKRCCPHDDTDGMGLSEALEWAFADPGGVTMLARIGITWNTIYTGGNHGSAGL